MPDREGHALRCKGRGRCRPVGGAGQALALGRDHRASGHFGHFDLIEQLFVVGCQAMRDG